jgi:hypothetical protein
MPKNKAIYLAVLVIAASGLLYLGHVLTEYVRPALPWTTGFGILVLIAGVFYEAKTKGGIAPAAADEDRTL